MKELFLRYYDGSRIQRFLRHPLTLPFATLMNLVSVIESNWPRYPSVSVFYVGLVGWMAYRYAQAWKEDGETRDITTIGILMWGFSAVFPYIPSIR